MFICLTLALVDKNFNFALPKNSGISASNLLTNFRKPILNKFLNKSTVSISLRPPVLYLNYGSMTTRLKIRIITCFCYFLCIKRIVLCAVDFFKINYSFYICFFYTIILFLQNQEKPCFLPENTNFG